MKAIYIFEMQHNLIVLALIFCDNLMNKPILMILLLSFFKLSKFSYYPQLSAIVFDGVY